MSEAQEPRYVEYALAVDSERAEEAIAKLQMRGIEYVWIDAPFETFVTEDGYGYQEVETERTTVRAYEEVGEEPTDELLAKLRGEIEALLGPLAHEVTASVPQAVTEDPVYEFTALEVRPGLMIRPPWDEERVAEETTILIEPSAAFGTGLHPTTRHCLELIDDMVRPGDAVADLGAGSGILSLLARMKGADPVVAVDLNPSAESSIGYHMELNGIEGIAIIIGDVFTEFADAEHRFDMVAVNIGGKEAIELAPLLTRIVKQEGVLLLSGIVEWIEAQVTDAFAALGWSVAERRQGEEWVTLAVKRVEQAVSPRQPRPVALGIVEQQGKILVEKIVGKHMYGEGVYYRPPGGGIEFGEHSEQAVVRELREELGVEVTPAEFLGFLENIFRVEGSMGHEIVALYRVRLADETQYEQDVFVLTDGDSQNEAVWVPLADFASGDKLLMPSGLLERIKQ
ncbi:ribosomal protein L11 methyltransferase [Tumebacillus sp. BK434]|uniref:50S ribosomal protein L11 methyltransferase n=1 Tax=Tumebacillus sp. BK434 TaxID=2512169 RepID=UPI001046C648|nr:50S ribosomal protein L11 methyltransferase [Tumebacillus sp. BK434]TCP55660.1 ribosomal protein L11 methyltransferase [Tumebacillus sp. BK434]